MWGTMLKEHLHLLQMAALVVGGGILILNAGRDVFEKRSDERAIEPPIGGPAVLVADFRYMNDYAEDARDELMDIVNILRAVLIPFAYVIVVSFAAVFLFEILGELGSAQRGASVCEPGVYRPLACFLWRGASKIYQWWDALSLSETILGVMSGVVILLGAYMVSKLASIVYHVILARSHYALHGQ